MLYSKGEEDDEKELKIEPFVQPLGSSGYPVDAETGKGYISPSDSDSVKRAKAGAKVSVISVLQTVGKGWGKPVDIFNRAKAKPPPPGHPNYSSILDPNSDHPLHQLPGQGHHQPNPVTIDDPEETSEDYDDDPEESEESPEPPEDPWHFLDNIYPSELRAREQAKKDRGENHLNEQQQKNALSCLKMLEANKIQKKKNASELLCVSSSSSSK